MDLLRPLFAAAAILLTATLAWPQRVAAGPEADALKPPAFRTSAVKRGELSQTISASGSVQPEQMVEVSAQISGQVQSLHAECGNVMKAGEVLAKLADDACKVDVEQARATLEHARAELVMSQAKMKICDSRYRRVEELRSKAIDAISPADIETTGADLEIAKAGAKAAEAAVAQAEAAVSRAQLNLANTVVTSPMTGTVVEVRASVGQTVTAGTNSASLFVVADLTKMQVMTQVSEADIAQVRKDAPVRFTCDAFPGKTFEGTVKQIRPLGVVARNVVTFPVVISTDNANARLLPFLTANVQIETAHVKDALLVPNAALRWQPRPEWEAPAADRPEPRPRSPHVWIQEGQWVKRIDVQVGPSDGTSTQITGGELKEGANVIVGTGTRE